MIFVTVYFPPSKSTSRREQREGEDGETHQVFRPLLRVSSPPRTTFRAGPVARLSNKSELLGSAEITARCRCHTAALGACVPSAAPSPVPAPGPSRATGHFRPRHGHVWPPSAGSRLGQCQESAPKKPRILGRHPLGGNVLPAERRFGESWGCSCPTLDAGSAPVPEPVVVHPIPSVSNWFQWAHPTLGWKSHFPASPPKHPRHPPAPGPATSLLPGAILQPLAPAGPHGVQGDPKPAPVSLPARSVCPRLKSQSDTSGKSNLWQDALGSGSTSCHPLSTDPPPKQLPRDPKHTQGPIPSLKPTAAVGPAHLGGTSGAVHAPSPMSHWRVTQAPPRKPRGPGEIGIASPPERLIPCTSYRRSLDLVSSWCEAVITLISCGIAFPPRANFVSTVTSPRGVRALRARRSQEPQEPHQAPRNRPETRGHPQNPHPQRPGQPRAPRAEPHKSPRCFPASQGSHLLLGASTRLWGKGVTGSRGTGGWWSPNAPADLGTAKPGLVPGCWYLL